MSSTKVSTKPCLHEQRPGESKGWDEGGLVEAALEGRLGLRDGIYRARGRLPALDAARAEPRVPPHGSAPLHVPGTASQVAMVRLLETTQPGDSRSAPLRAKLVRALGFLAVILGTLLLADLLS